jgi:regulator of nucleoside diphosphate kinase
MSSRATGNAASRQPAIRPSATGHALLTTLVGDSEACGVTGLLQQEPGRATIDQSGRRLPTVGLNRSVHSVDDRGGGRRRVRIVPSSEADIDRGLITPLSHVRAGLRGPGAGQSIRWPDPAGRMRKLTAVLIEDDDALVRTQEGPEIALRPFRILRPKAF